MSRRVQVPLKYVLRIAARDEFTCHVCEMGYNSNDPWEIDHEIPLARGGTNHLSNLKLSHRSCNRDKADS
jgi:RNA-directed DNA polymerase